MNRIYRSIWNDKTGTFVAASEHVKGAGKRSSSGTSPASGSLRFMLKGLAASLMLAFGGQVFALPTGGVVSAGSAGIAGGTGAMTVNQSSQNVAINWQGFSIGSGEAVRFVQPNGSSVALNRVLGSDPSSILGSLSANGKVFLVNPNGILFGQGAAVNVGGLVASTLNISDSDFMAGNYQFFGAGKGTVENLGAINADGGYVALLGANVSNQGVISARLGTVALAAGQAVTLDLAGDGLLNVAVTQGAVNALVDNGGLIRADGGQVLLTAQAAGDLLQSAVNNTGVIEAQTLQNHNGTIKLLGGMQDGSVNVGGKLDASAPDGGDGGFVETSAAHVKVADNAVVTTRSVQGQSGNWLIDPTDFTIATTGGDMTGTALTTSLAGGAVTILSSNGASGTKGDVNVNAPVSWSANMLTLTASNDINVNAVMTASGAASLALNPGTGTVVTGRDSLGNFIGRVDFSGAGTLAIGGTSYTVINSLGAPGSITGTDLQGINGSAGNLAGHYALGANIDATATGTAPWGAGFLPIGVFTGTFDGLGHTITGLTINRSGTADVGLFGNVAAGTSTLRNVGLVGGSVTGAAGTGGLIGNSGAGVSVNNVSNTGSVSGAAGSGGLIGSNGAGNAVSNSYATGAVSGAAGTGGLVGSNGAGSLVSNSYAIGNVTGAAGAAGVGGLLGSNGDLSTVSKSYAAGNVTMSGAGGASVGGLVGSNSTGNVSDSYATGNIVGNNAAGVGGLMGSNTSAAVHNTYAVGSVSGSGAGVGALVGSSNPGTVTDSYWNSDTSTTQTTAGGGIGMTTANMKKQLDFTSATAANNPDAPTWDFANTWFMYEGKTYPLLRPFMRPLTVTANSASATYNGTAQTGGGGVSYSSTPNVNLLGTVSTSGGGTSVGSYAITPSGLYSNQQGYIISYANGAVTISPASLTVTAANISKSYGQTATPTAYTAAGLVGGDTIGSVTETSAGTAATASVAGSPYAITPSVATGGSFVPGNYTIAYVNGALTVIPVALTVTASSVTKNYGQAPTLSAFTAAGLVNGDTIGSVTETSAGQPATASVAGSPYAITPSAATGGSFVPGNYTIAYVDGVLTVIPGTLTVTAADITKIYGQTPTLTSFTAAGLANGDTVTGVTETSPGQPAAASVAGSPYAITPSVAIGNFVPANYTIAYVNGVLKVITAPLTIAAPDVTMSYGQTPVLSTFTPTGLLNGDTVGSVTGTSPGTLANASSTGGSYAITPSSATGGTFTPSNYSIGYVDGTLMVTSAIVPSETVPTVPGESPANSWMPGIVLAAPPPQLLTIAAAEVPATPPPVVQQQAPIVVPAEAPRKPYVAPRRPRKQDLN
ncbi:heme/hemopexin-binding protein precursor [mine drainage metagenome]|uniref:Heme/hemopexin-binding protein n=1 Tax=mine drainage metagenome TaxID=410659 RepID=A0A1J5RJA8_9ZZZZ